MVVNVYVSAVTQDNISRHDLLAWVNCTLQSNLCKIEEMSTGAAYCQLTHLLFRDGINLKKVKWNSRNEMDHINNWKILGTAWKAIGIDKPLQVERLTKGKFQDNFEFLQWFYKFFKANFDGSDDYDPFAARGGEKYYVVSNIIQSIKPLPASAKGPGTNRNGSNARVPPSRPIPSVVKKCQHLISCCAAVSTGSAASGTVVTKVVEEKDAEISRLRAATQEVSSFKFTSKSLFLFYFYAYEWQMNLRLTV
uniref:Calponin-homology (CH) domain-containing protein n=1 Tax=Heterorhabditis bacteriophora TaxID=37862 RepID=A0A1I7XRL7_HETBA